jgi:hypothetical protein
LTTDDSAEEPARAKARRDAIAALVVVGALTAIAVGRPLLRRLAAHPSRDTCRALLDQHAALVARQATPEKPHRPGEPKLATPKPVPDADPAVSACARELTVAEAECAARAGDADAFERCLP